MAPVHPASPGTPTAARQSRRGGLPVVADARDLRVNQAPGEHQVEIQLGHLCNDRCVFCVSGRLSQLRQVGQIPAEPVIEKLREARAQGVRKVTFLGGEPTIQHSFEEVLQAAVDLGFEEIVLFTNGVRIHDAAWVESVVAMGGNLTWRISIQGADAESHDRTVQRRGAFEKIVEGLSHLTRLGQRITVNVCVVEQNYRSVPKFPALLRPFNVVQLHLDLMRPSDVRREDAYLRTIMPRLTDLRGPYIEMLAGFPEEFDVNIGNLPYCQVPAWAHRIHHGGEMTVTYSAGGGRGDAHLDEGMNKYEHQRSDKIKLPGCTRCVFNSICDGVFEKYVEFFGPDELQPVPLEDLRALDREQRLFVHLCEPYIEALTRPGGPFAPRRVLRDALQRMVRIEYAGGLALEFIPARPQPVTRPFFSMPQPGPPPDPGRPAFARSADFRLATGAPLDAPRQRELMEWAAGTLSALLPVEREPEPAPRAGPSPIARILRTAAALRGRELSGWRMAGAAPLSTGDGLSLRFEALGRRLVVALRVRGDAVSCEVQSAPHEGHFAPLIAGLAALVER